MNNLFTKFIKASLWTFAFVMFYVAIVLSLENNHDIRMRWNDKAKALADQKKELKAECEQSNISVNGMINEKMIRLNFFINNTNSYKEEVCIDEIQ